MNNTPPIDYLAACGIKPSLQRIAVMEYLMTHRTHPTVDEIYTALVGRMPTLSKTTVYNTLRLFVEQRAARQLTIDERKVMYDGDMSQHAHFFCRRCSKVFDIPMKKNCPKCFAHLSADFGLEHSDLYFRGLCPACREEEQNNQPLSDNH